MVIPSSDLVNMRTLLRLSVRHFSKDTQQDRTFTKAVAATTSCVCLNTHSGKRTSTEDRDGSVQSTASNMNCQMQDEFATTSSPKITTTENHFTTHRLRVQCVTRRVVQQP